MVRTLEGTRSSMRENFMVDDGGRWNIVDKTYNGDTWLHKTTIRETPDTSLYTENDRGTQLCT